MAPKNKFYIVEHIPGDYRVFDNWPECQAFVRGKPYPFAGGVTKTQAMNKLAAAKRKRSTSQANGTRAKSGSSRSKTKPDRSKSASHRPSGGICSDAGTHGNPGPCEYQVTDLSGQRLLHRHLGVHSNNYAELAGIGAMIKYAIQHGETVLWTDSTIAMGWIKSLRVGPTVHEPDKILDMARIINKLLRENPQIKLKKWDTRSWGQIPADFGRK